MLQFLENTGQDILTELRNLNSFLSNSQNNLHFLVSSNIDFTKVDNGASLHNSFFRGKNLGTMLSQSQIDAINNGSFDDLFIGDFWVINGIYWRILHFDPFYGLGSLDSFSVAGNCSAHHIAVAPDSGLYLAFAGNGSTNGGYYNSLLRTNLASATSTIENSFGADHIMTYNDTLSNAADNGVSTACADYSCNVEIMSESMVFGTHFAGSLQSINQLQITSGVLPSYCTNQFALFRLRPDFIKASNGSLYWLRDICAPNSFFAVYANGALGSAPTNSGNGSFVRPFFLLH